VELSEVSSNWDCFVSTFVVALANIIQAEQIPFRWSFCFWISERAWGPSQREKVQGLFQDRPTLRLGHQRNPRAPRLPPSHRRWGRPWVCRRFFRILWSHAADLEGRSDALVRVGLERQRQARPDRRDETRVVVPDRLLWRPRLDVD